MKKYFIPEKEAIAYPEGKNGKQICTETAAGRREYDARRVEMWLRQDCLCALCGKWVDVSEATFEHQYGRGGGKRDDRIVVDGEWHNAAVHGVCNSDKASKRRQWVNGKYVEVNKFKEVA